MYDAIFIGGGPGGYAAAIRAAQLKAKVAVVEKDALGGTCLNRGCIPTKALVSTVARLDAIRSAGEFGLQVHETGIDLKQMLARKDRVVEQLTGGIGLLFKKHKVELLPGTGRVSAPGKVEVRAAGGTITEYETKNIILATGSEPALIKSLGYDGQKVITSTEALKLTQLPGRLLIVGGGVIGCEFATIFSRLGVKVTIIEALPQILSKIDSEIARRLAGVLKRQGITIKTGVPIAEVKKEGEEVKAVLPGGEEITADQILISIGRSFNTENLGLEEIGVKRGSKGEVEVNDYLQTSVEGIYAIGDITNKIQLAHVATAQGLRLVENLFGAQVKPMDYRCVPSCIYTLPEVSSVGLTSEEAKEQGININTGKFSFGANGRALAAGEAEGIVKVLADAQTDRIVGVHMIGPHVTDLIAEAALAVQNGLTVEEVVATIHAHPTLAEAFLEAAEAVHGQSIHG